MAFLGGIFLICIFQAVGGHLFMTSTKKMERGGGAGGTKFWPILPMVMHGFLRKGFSFRDM